MVMLIDLVRNAKSASTIARGIARLIKPVGAS
jgi:hypothetical protein